MTDNLPTLSRHPMGHQHLDVPCPEFVDPGTETLYPLRGEGSALVIGKCLSRNSLLKLVGDHSGELISCLNGVAWITQSGNPDDFVIYAGESFTITEKGTILIQGMKETRLTITCLSLERQGLTQTYRS